MQLELKAKALSTERLNIAHLKDDQAAMQKLAVIERDLRYVSARLKTAILSTPPENSELVLFGATVTVENEAGEPNIFIIVGDDEADIKLNKVSWSSPIAKALIKQKVGDIVVWSRPAGNITLEIIKISY
jgi:transcription elongation GreA/GreB family factor